MLPASRCYFLLLLGVAIAFLLAIFVDRQVSILGTLFYDAIVLGLTFADALRLKPHRVEVSRFLLQRLSIGRDNVVKLLVKAGDRSAKILIRDYYPLEFQVSESILQATLTPNSTQELTYQVFPKSRGEFEWGEIQVRQLGQWGLAWHDWKIPASEKVAVYPDLAGLRSLSIRLTLQNTGTMRQMRRFGMGTEFAELREYTQGDDLRAIDWKSTARHGRPLVRVLEPDREQTLIILLDRGRLMTAQVKGLKRFDWGLNATLSLALAGLNRGDRVGVSVFDRVPIAWIPPERGDRQLINLIERLTPIQPVLLEPDYVGAVTKVVNSQTRRALVVLITDIVDATASAELLAAMRRLTPRYLPFCVALRDPKVDAIAHISTDTIKAAYSRAVALDLLEQRQVAFAQLKQKGVLVLDAPADKIGEHLVDRYLQLKARNLL
ncbi:MAG: DUF58 domain-containing protein [Hydrococcus sp. Prado102]|jgi:uncharacterized protein (DUF58 family)|nr:DUF58 domain-containing protein [Hydrococcus sp. Prado102]